MTAGWPGRVLGALLLTAVLAAPTDVGTTAAAGPPGPAGGDQGPICPDGHPCRAQNRYEWGHSAWEDEFRQPLRASWKTDQPAHVRTKVGLISLEADAGTGTLTATNSSRPARYGRWETRIHAFEKKRTDQLTPYRFVFELVPAGPSACGGIVLASYRQDDAAARGVVVTPSARFTFQQPLRTLGFADWHTYAVEVTRDHISWFVDGRVRRTERRPEALDGVALVPRYRMQAVRGAQMAAAKLQADWVRYYTLERPNQRSIKAPPMRREADGC